MAKTRSEREELELWPTANRRLRRLPHRLPACLATRRRPSLYGPSLRLTWRRLARARSRSNETAPNKRGERTRVPSQRAPGEIRALSFLAKIQVMANLPKGDSYDPPDSRGMKRRKCPRCQGHAFELFEGPRPKERTLGYFIRCMTPGCTLTEKWIDPHEP